MPIILIARDSQIHDTQNFSHYVVKKIEIISIVEKC